jgi:hypothetical protein
MPNLNVRISKEQEDFIKKKAEINNMNISEYVKSCLFNKNENKQVKINNEENKNNLDDINNKILKVNTNVIKSHNILDSNLSKIEMQINTLVYFILLIIQLFKPNNFDEAKKMLSKAKNIAKIEQQEEANKK